MWCDNPPPRTNTSRQCLSRVVFAAVISGCVCGGERDVGKNHDGIVKNFNVLCFGLSLWPMKNITIKILNCVVFVFSS